MTDRADAEGQEEFESFAHALVRLMNKHQLLEPTDADVPVSPDFPRGRAATLFIAQAFEWYMDGEIAAADDCATFEAYASKVADAAAIAEGKRTGRIDVPDEEDE